MYVHISGRLIAAPLLLAALISFMCALIGLRGDAILKSVYGIGMTLELRLAAGDRLANADLTFGSVEKAKPLRGHITYGRVLLAAFLIVSIAFAVLAIYFLHAPPRYAR